MVWLELISITDEFAKYKYYPEHGETYGVVTVNRINGERSTEKEADGYPSFYKGHAWRAIEKMQEEKKFQKTMMVAWC